MGTFFICDSMQNAEIKKEALERDGYFVKIVKRDGKYHVDASITKFSMESKPKGYRKRYREWKPTKDELDTLTSEENSATI